MPRRDKGNSRKGKKGRKTPQRSLNFGGRMAVRLPWFTGFVPGEVIAVTGKLAEGQEMDPEHPVFCVDRQLTFDRCSMARLEGFDAGSVPQAGASTQLLALCLADGLLQPLLWLPPLNPPQVIIGWFPEVVLVEANLHLVERICALKLEIRRNLLEIFELFGAPAPGVPLGPVPERFHLAYVLVLELARIKKKLDQKTLKAALDAIRECLPNIDDEAKRMRIADKLEKLAEAMSLKTFFEESILEPLFGNEFNPKDDDGEYSGFPYWDRTIAESVIETIKRLDEYLEEFADLKTQVAELTDNEQGGAGERPSPGESELRDRLEDLLRELNEKKEAFERAQEENEERLLGRVAEACRRNGDLERILDEIARLLSGLFHRNLRFLDIARYLADQERRNVRRARRLLAAVIGLLDAEKETIDRAVAREREAMGGGDDAELRARKLNLLLQFQQVVKEQCDDMLPGDSGVVLDFDLPPDTLEGKLEGKEDEASRILDWLEGREDKLREGLDLTGNALRPN